MTPKQPHTAKQYKEPINSPEYWSHRIYDECYSPISGKASVPSEFIGVIQQAAINAHLAQVSEGLPTEDEMEDALILYARETAATGHTPRSWVRNLFAERFAERFAKLEAELEDSRQTLGLRIDSLRLDKEKLQAERDEARQLLGDRLAVIHRDGAHYIEENGLAGAKNDAVSVILNERQELAEAHAACDGFAVRNIKDSYPEGSEPRELSLAERINVAAKMIADYQRWLSEAEGKHDETNRVAVDALEFYGPQGDFDLGDYEMKLVEDGGDIAREALTKLKGNQ